MSLLFLFAFWSIFSSICRCSSWNRSNWVNIRSLVKYSAMFVLLFDEEELRV